MWVLEGFDGIENVKMDLERDAFTISYLPDVVQLDAILTRIRRLGFRPEPIAEPPPVESKPVESGKPLPDPIQTALDGARGEKRLLLIDFFADWCDPCITLDKEVLVDSRVAEALRRFRLLKIDTDRDSDSARWFRVFALPTLLVLDERGNEIYRHEGSIGAAELAALLPGIGNSGPPAREENN